MNTNNFDIEPPADLMGKITKRIHKEERLLVLRRTIIFSFLLIGSLAGFIPSIKTLLSDFNRTGFVTFFSLFFSDFSLVSKYWQSFMMILLETLPALSIALVLALLIIFIQSAKSLTKNIKIIKSHHLMAS